MAEIEKEGAETVYVTAEGLDDAFKNSGNDGATFTLLKDVESEKVLEIVIDCTLNLGGHTSNSLMQVSLFMRTKM